MQNYFPEEAYASITPQAGPQGAFYTISASTGVEFNVQSMNIDLPPASLTTEEEIFSLKARLLQLEIEKREAEAAQRQSGDFSAKGH
jgi:hypothetical protein